jgi:hypothetical protein
MMRRPGARDASQVNAAASPWTLIDPTGHYFVAGDEPGLAETYGWDWHKVVLETVDLHPEEALDALGPSESP